MLVSQFADLKARINGLIIKSTSVPSSASEISTPTSNNARSNPPLQPRYPIKKPSMRLFPEMQAPLPTIKVITKHSHAFNSSTSTGLDKLGQLQFAEVVKGWIIETAPLITASRADKNTSYKVVFTARKSDTEMSLVHASVTAASLYRAKLFASEPSPLGSDWALVMQSGEMEILIDALEDLWEMVMHRAGSLADGVDPDAVLKECETARGCEEKAERKSVGW